MYIMEKRNWILRTRHISILEWIQLSMVFAFERSANENVYRGKSTQMGKWYLREKSQ